MSQRYQANLLMIASVPVLIYGLKCLVDSAYLQSLVLVMSSFSMGRLGSIMYVGRTEDDVEGQDEHLEG